MRPSTGPQRDSRHGFNWEIADARYIPRKDPSGEVELSIASDASVISGVVGLAQWSLARDMLRSWTKRDALRRQRPDGRRTCEA
jgi:hypothetical protein